MPSSERLRGLVARSPSRRLRVTIRSSRMRSCDARVMMRLSIGLSLGRPGPARRPGSTSTTSSSATAASSTAPARPGTPATSASAAAASPRSAGSTGAAARQTVDAEGRSSRRASSTCSGQSELDDPGQPAASRRRSSRGSRPRSPARAARPAPLNDAIIAADRAGYDHYGITPDWRTLGEYFARLEQQGLGINLASYVGATQVRRMVLGDGDQQPTPGELDSMRALVREAMRDGAVGVSTALQYPPAPYAETEELIALASEAARLGGVYATHMRSESDEIHRRARRGDPDRPRGADPGRGLAPQDRRASRTGVGCPRWSRRSTRPARPESTSPRTPTRIRRGSTRCRRSSRRGPTTAAPRS